MTKMSAFNDHPVTMHAFSVYDVIVLCLKKKCKKMINFSLKFALEKEEDNH